MDGWIPPQQWQRGGGGGVVEGTSHTTAVEKSRGRLYRPSWRPTAWSGRRFLLGNSKEVSDAGHAIYQAMKSFDERNERIRQYTISSDSTAAIGRAATDSQGPGKALATTIIEVEKN